MDLPSTVFSQASPSLGSLSHQKSIRVGVLASPPDHEPRRTYEPLPSHGHRPQPSQCWAWSRCLVNVMEPPGPASTMEDLPFPKIGPLFLLLPKTLPVAQQLQRHFRRWREPAEGRESVCRLMSTHNNSPSASLSDIR